MRSCSNCDLLFSDSMIIYKESVLSTVTATEQWNCVIF